MKFTPTVLPPPMLDVGEGWAAIIGVGPVLSKRVEKITESQFKEAAKIHETITKRARSLVNGTIVPAQVPIVDYMKTLELSSGAMDEAQIVAMQSALPPNDQGAYMVVAQRQYTAIQATIPKLSYTTGAGEQIMTPDLSELVDFSDFYALLDDPLVTVFGAIAGGSLHMKQAEFWQEAFPSMTKVITAAIQDAIAERVAKAPGFTLPWKVEIGYAAWSGKPPEIPAPSAQPPPMPEEQPGEDKSDRSGMTPAEKLESA